MEERRLSAFAGYAALAALAVGLPEVRVRAHGHSGSRSRGTPHRESSCTRCRTFLKIGQAGLCAKCKAKEP